MAKAETNNVAKNNEEKEVKMPTVITVDEEKKVVVVIGVLSQNIIKPGYKGKGAEKRNISIKMARALTDSERLALAYLCNTAIEDKYCPHAIKEKKEYFTVKTSFDIPCGDYSRKRQYDIEEVGLGSKVRLACRLKDNAIYPISMVVDQLVEFDPFNYFD